MRLLKDSGVEWIGEIPEGWKTPRLKATVRLITDKEEWQAGTAYVGLENLESQTGKYLSSGEEVVVDGPSTKFEKGDVLFNKLRPYLYKCLHADFDGICSSELLVLRDFSGETRFLFYTLMSHGFMSVVDSTTYGAKMPRANWTTIGNMPIPFPDITEQRNIASYLDAKRSVIDSTIEDEKKSIELLKGYKQSLISYAVTRGLEASLPAKETEIDWIGTVPASWDVVPLTRFLESIVDYRGKTPTKVDDGVFLVTAKNIKNGKIDYSLSQEYVAEEEYAEVMRRGAPEIGDVLFTTEAPLGEVANVDNPNVALAQRVIKFRGKKDILDNYFLKYWLMSSGFQGHLASLATGSTAQGIKASKLSMLLLVLPSLAEQKEIVKYLDGKCAAIDSVIEKKQRLITKLSEYRQSLIYEAVTGKIQVAG